MRKTILTLFVILFCFSIGIAELQEEELSEEEKAILKKAIEIIKKHEERDIYELIFEDSKREREDWKERIYGKAYLEREEEDRVKKLKKENDRLEDLLEKLRNERSSLEWDMMRYRWDLEDAKPDPLDYQMALDSAIASAMIAPHPFYDSWSYSYYPSSLRQVDRTNYEALLFTLSTDSKGKMDWTKYGWLKLLMKNK